MSELDYQRDKGTAGIQIYDHMLDLDPDFFVHLGDIVYYDKKSAGGDVDALTPELARFHWNRWYGCYDVVKFHRQINSFFIKDDHDTLTNDSIPGQKVGNLTWDDGLTIFKEQVPIGDPTYRTRRWSKDLQFWIVEGRDYRSPNRMPDGEGKSIWGPEQKEWFMDGVRFGCPVQNSIYTDPGCRSRSGKQERQLRQFQLDSRRVAGSPVLRREQRHCHLR